MSQECRVENQWKNMLHIKHKPPTTITLLRVIPTMTFIRFVTGKSSDISSVISAWSFFFKHTKTCVLYFQFIQVIPGNSNSEGIHILEMFFCCG